MIELGATGSQSQQRGGGARSRASGRSVFICRLSRPEVGHMTLGLFQTSDTATGEVSPHNSNVSSRFACFGAFRMDLQRQQLYRGGSRIKLPGKVCDVLLILLERPGEVVTRENMRIRL